AGASPEGVFWPAAPELGPAAVALAALLAVLPGVAGQSLGRGLDPGHVLVVGEMRPEGAAAVVGSVGVDPLAAGAVDAGPVRGQPGQVAAEPLRVLGFLVL